MTPAFFGNLDLIGQSAQIEAVAPGKDALAKQEEQFKFRNNQRGESYRIHIHKIVVTGIWVIGFVMLALIAIRAWHLAAPAYGRWLNEHELHGIERIIFSGVIVTLATKYFRHYKVLGD